MQTATARFIRILLGSFPLAVVLLLGPTLMGPDCAKAEVLHVPGEYYTIQHALASAGAGDTVLVAPGYYCEDIVWPSTQGIQLLSEAGADATIIDALGYDRVLRIDTHVDSTTLIRGFTMTNGTAALGGGIYCHYSQPTISGNIITGNDATLYGAGIYCAGPFYYPVIDSNIISNNTVLDGSGGAVCCYEGSAPRITNNTIIGNSADIYFGGAVHCENGMDTGREIVISGNTIEGNSAYGGGAISLINPFPLVPSITHNVIIDNSATHGGAIFSGWSLAIIENNVIRQNQASQYGGGVYAETSHEIVIRNNEIELNTASQSGGGIALMWNSTVPIVSGNTIKRNTAMAGGGIHCYNRSSPTIVNNYIGYNEAVGEGGGIGCDYNCHPTIRGNAIMRNEAGSGGGISISQSYPEITDCTISENSGSGIYIADAIDQGLPLMNYNSICGNGAYGVFSEDSSVTINALYNWWGHETGPYHEVLNVGGQGDRVGEYIDFIPWLEGPGGVAEVVPGRVESVWLLDCQPNPFRHTTRIRFMVPPKAGWEIHGSAAAGAGIEVYDVAGRLVRSFRVGDVPWGATGEVRWSGEDNNGCPVRSGVHYIRMDIGGKRQVQKVILLR